DEIGAERARLRDAVHDAARVALDVPDRGIDLGETHAVAPHAAIVTAGCYHRRMPAKVPWLPSVVPPGARPERCPRCGRMALIPGRSAATTTRRRSCAPGSAPSARRWR